ncbi:GDSL-type esterase/lipase family protein [Paenibacillus pasadenensis]|uniref:GDSL-type esterase/lipase family protein n=1 Tax=Paenibacillus pasadenensis TaxID=217090 RepID=UPI00203B5F9E|nr:GDSL-type esterase/lipase family protein [Paenibacillus pasadenensis]MCM3749037.1 GDSL-type esterase/lipase family protein [Paenibacillus pasadenensis]
MRPSSKLWRIVGTAALASTLLLAVGFAMAMRELLVVTPLAQQTGTAPAQQIETGGGFQNAEEIRVTALGDSLTKGTGDNSGKGYVKTVLELLREETGKPVHQINNLAVAGLTAKELDDMLSRDDSLEYPIKQANLILLTIGGNDLFRPVLEARESGEAGDINLETIEAGIPAAAESLRSVVERIRAINPDATLVYTSLYNPFYDIPDLREGSAAVQKWNGAAYEIIGSDELAVVVPIMDLFQQRSADYMSSDHFHPNQQGYERIAQRIAQALT